MAKTGEFVHTVFAEARHAGTTALDAVVDAAHYVRLQTEETYNQLPDMPMVQATAYKVERVNQIIDMIADRLWDKLTKR